MFRSQQEQNMADNQESIKEEIEFLSRVYSIPTVNVALKYALDTYSKTKERNALFNFTLGTAEKSIAVALHTAEPVVNKFQTPVKFVDGIACKGLDKLEEKMPFIKQTPEQMIENTKSYYNGKIEEGVNRYNDVKNSGTQKVLSTANALLETSYGKYVVQKVDDSLTMTDDYVDYLLPGTEESDVKSATNPLQRASRISNKVYHRLLKHATQQVDVVQSNARNTLAQLNVAVLLIDRLKKNVNDTNERLSQSYTTAQTQIQELYQQLIKDDDESFADKKNLNDKLFYVTRQLTKKLISSLNTIVATSQSVPEAINEKIHQSQVYANDMYSYIRQATNIGDMNNQVLETFKPRIEHIQESLNELRNYPVVNQALQYFLWLTKNFQKNIENVDNASGEVKAEENVASEDVDDQSNEPNGSE